MRERILVLAGLILAGPARATPVDEVWNTRVHALVTAVQAESDQASAVSGDLRARQRETAEATRASRAAYTQATEAARQACAVRTDPGCAPAELAAQEADLARRLAIADQLLAEHARVDQQLGHARKVLDLMSNALGDLEALPSPARAEALKALGAVQAKTQRFLERALPVADALAQQLDRMDAVAGQRAPGAELAAALDAAAALKRFQGPAAGQGADPTRNLDLLRATAAGYDAYVVLTKTLKARVEGRVQSLRALSTLKSSTLLAGEVDAMGGIVEAGADLFEQFDASDRELDTAFAELVDAQVAPAAAPGGRARRMTPARYR